MVTRIGEFPADAHQTAQTGSAEIAHNTLEPLPDYEQRLASLIEASPDVVEQYRPALARLTEKAVRGCLSDHDREAMILTGELVDWKLFGKYGSPLPRGLQKFAPNSQKPHEWSIGYRYTLGYSANCFDASLQKYPKQPFSEIIDAVVADRYSRKPAIDQALTDLLTTSPIYQFINAFAIAPPLQSKAPLNTLQRAILESQIDRKYDIDVTMRGTHAARLAHREKSQLDDVRVPTIESATTNKSPIDSLKSYFYRRIRAKIPGNHADAPIFSRYNNPSSNALLTLYLQKGTEVIEIDEELLGVTDDMCDKLLSPQTSEAYFIQQSFLNNFIRLLFIKDQNAALQQITSQAIINTRLEYVPLLVGASVKGIPNDTDCLIRNPTGPIVEDSLKRYSTAHTHPTVRRSYIATAEEIDRDYNTIIGHVLQPDQDNEHSRLIQKIPAKASTDLLRNDFSQEDLSLVFLEEAEGLYIPGYKLVSKKGATFGFIRDPNGDPYEAEPMALPGEHIAKLMNIYQDMALPTLADGLNSGSIQTVQDLVEAIKIHSIYPVESLEQSSMPASLEINTLHDFTPTVKDGALFVQCTGASLFLKLSLDALFGEGYATIESGHVLDHQDVIRKDTHAQVKFSYNGAIVILDSTASAGFTTHGLQTDKPPRRRKPYTPSAKQEPVPSALEEDLDITRSPAEIRHAGIIAIKQSVESQLSVVLNVPSEKLYSTVTKRPPSDPIRHLLQTILQIEQYQSPGKQVTATLHYLEKYRAANPALLRKHRLQPYETELLDSLRLSAQRLGQLLLATES